MTMFEEAAAVVAVLGLVLIGVLFGGVAGFLLGRTCLYRVGSAWYESRHADDPPTPRPDDEHGFDTGEIPVRAEELALLSGHDGDGPGLFGGGRHRRCESDDPEWATVTTG
jgi:hypothetical protein